MLPGKRKIRGFPLIVDLMSTDSKITLTEICALFQDVVISVSMFEMSQSKELYIL